MPSQDEGTAPNQDSTVVGDGSGQNDDPTPAPADEAGNSDQTAEDPLAAMTAAPTPWMTWANTPIYRRPNSPIAVYCYTTSHFEIDADGAPNAYGPNNIGLDWNANAMYPDKNWQSVLVVDPADPARPYVQTSGDYAGYFVSGTSLRDHSKPDTDVTKYVDAGAIPYIVFPGGFLRAAGTGDMGDLVIARLAGGTASTAAVVADSGGWDQPLGEVSVALAASLGVQNPNPRGGPGPSGPVQYLVFPGSRSDPAWPRTLDDITTAASALFDQIGGWDDAETWAA